MPPLPRRPKGAPQRSQSFTLPAPMGGLNTQAPGTAAPPTDCLAVWNLIAAENGLRSRLGFREWCTGLTGTTDNKVRTLMSFSGSQPNRNALFAATDTRIYDVSSSSVSPTVELTFASNTGEAGYGTFRVVVTPTGGHFGIYCDEVNGYHVYTESGTAWSKVAQGSGAGEIDNVDPGTFVHATVFKKRVWFTEKHSSSAWYLSAGAISGAATEFPFGSHFTKGGHLVGLWNWTYDGGAGIDDSLVAISSAGDVVVVNGTDPDDPLTFQVRGVWNMGPPPAGRDIARDVGGDLYLLSSLGILPISRLVVGAETRAFETIKVQNLFNVLMLTRRTSRGWSMHLHPQDNALILLYPDYSTDADQQLVQALGAQGRPWFRYEGLPMHCADVWDGKLHFGTQDGRVCVSQGDLDEVLLSDPNSYEEIEWRLLTTFQKQGGRNVRVHAIRPLFVADGSAPDYAVEARYDFDLSEASEEEEAAIEAGTWDNALWDVDVWGDSTVPTSAVVVGTGVGHSFAITLRGSNVARTTLVDFDVLLEAGGWL